MRPQFYLIVVFVLASYTYAQDISGRWRTVESTTVFSELVLEKQADGTYTGTSYEEEPGAGSCNYNLVGVYIKEKDRFKLSNTTLIHRTSDEHVGGVYFLKYKSDGKSEYLIGYVQTQKDYNAMGTLLGAKVKYKRMLDVPEEEVKQDSLQEGLEEVIENDSVEVAELTTLEPDKLDPNMLSRIKKEREDRVVAEYKIENNRKIEIGIRDYGEEDQDAVSVFLDDQIILSNHTISKNPYKREVNIDTGKASKLTFVANNLGTIPPNTCTVSIKIGDKTYVKKLFTDEKYNAVIQLVP